MTLLSTPASRILNGLAQAQFQFPSATFHRAITSIILLDFLIGLIVVYSARQSVS
jgi:hypothetical protein